MDENGDREVPYNDVTLYVTRHDTATGLSVTRPFLLKVNSLHLDGIAMSLDGGEEVMSGEGTVELQQGTRVLFIPKVTTNKGIENVKYSWSLEKPINKPFFSRYGGRNGMDGITSELQNPTCFYYNGGYYPVTLTVTDGRCTSTLSDTSLYIPESSVRSYRRALTLDEEIDNVYEENENLVLFEHFKVYPLLVTDYVTIESNQPNAKHEARLVDEQGRIMQIIKFMGSARIEMSGYASGVYYVCLDNGERHRILKR